MKRLFISAFALALGACAAIYGVKSDDDVVPEPPKPSSVDATPPEPPGLGDAVAVASGIGHPRELATDGTSVYVATEEADGYGQIRGYPPNGGAPVIVFDHTYRSRGLGLDGTRVYWTGGAPSGGVSYVYAADRAGGGARSEMYIDDNGSDVYGTMAVLGTTVAWSDANRGGVVYRGRTDGAGVLVLADKQGLVTSLAISGAYVYWCSNNTLLRRSSDPNASIETLVTRGILSDVVVDGTTAFVSSDDGAVLAVDAAVTPPSVRVVADGLATPGALAVDETTLYVVSTAEHVVYALPRTGAGSKKVVAKAVEPYRLAVTATDLWIVDRGGGALLRAPKR